MSRLANLSRLLRIARVLIRHDLDELITAIHLFRPYRLWARLAPWRWVRFRAPAPRGERIREALEELGPVFVKFGQMLSTRPDLLPEDIALELAKLQDQVPPFPGAAARDLVGRGLAGGMSGFRRFDETPIASASVAQVHLAELHDGTEVAVKVLRPGIQAIIERDVALLHLIARLALRYSPESRRLRPTEVVDEFDKTIHDELDLRREAANASRLRANFEGNPLLYVPKVYWDLTSAGIMTMERIHGIPVSNVEALKAAGVDMKRLADHGVEIFFTQAFRDGYFHADMHPGNIFVSPEGQYRAVDFGIMGSLSEKDKAYLAENFLGFFNRDYRAVSEAHIRAGWVPRGTRVEEFEAAIRTVCEPIFGRPIKDISFGHFLLQLFQTARRFNMEVQPQLVLLQKTLFNIEGLGRRLYPELDLWDTAKPFLERWMKERLGPRALLRTLRREFPRWWQMAPELPGLMHDTLRSARDGGLAMEWRSRDLVELRREMRRAQRRTILSVLGGALIVAGAVLVSNTAIASGPVVAVAGWTAAVVGALAILRMLTGHRQL